MSGDPQDDGLRRALREALPPVASGEPARDLWPLLRRRLERRPVVVSTLDWALIAALLTGLIVFPEGLVTWLYHL